jgi:transcriptional regulator NrdR
MKCPFCGSTESNVIDSRMIEDGAATRRRRSCGTCNARFTTYERYHATPLMVVKRNNRREAYDRAKLRAGIANACNKRNIEGRKPVVKIDPETNEIIKEYSSVNIAAENENICAGDISKCCKGYRIKTLKGYKYRYKGHEDVEYTGRYKKK